MLGVQMNWKWYVAGVVLAGVQSVFAQGSLTPPGVPGATMKTLDQIEPRTPISSVPYTISQSGSYYFTTNLTSSTLGVVIVTNNVTLDLMGFTLSGDGGSSDFGIVLSGTTNRTIQNVMVRNGIVRNFGIGILAMNTQDSRFERLCSESHYHYGIDLDGSSGLCNGNRIAHCTFSDNHEGIYLDGSAGGQCDGNTISRCTVRSNETYGIHLYGESGQCDGNTITDCTVSDNSSYGISFYGYSGQCDDNMIANCTISDNSSHGIYLTGSSGGRCAGNTIADCTIRKNKDRGLNLYSVDGNRVEGNHISDQAGTATYGIYCSGTKQNLIVRNTCVGQTVNFSMDSDDTYGPIVTNTGALSGSNPWANFSR